MKKTSDVSSVRLINEIAAVATSDRSLFNKFRADGIPHNKLVYVRDGSIEFMTSLLTGEFNPFESPRSVTVHISCSSQERYVRNNPCKVYTEDTLLVHVTSGSTFGPSVTHADIEMSSMRGVQLSEQLLIAKTLSIPAVGSWISYLEKAAMSKTSGPGICYKAYENPIVPPMPEMTARQLVSQSCPCRIVGCAGGRDTSIEIKNVNGSFLLHMFTF